MLSGDYWIQEVRCPYCGHFFMTMNFNSCKNQYVTENQTRSGWSETCPKCSGSLIMLENEPEGKRETDCVHIGDYHFY